MNKSHTILILVLLLSCTKENDPSTQLPTLTTSAVTAISSNSASSGGNVTSAGSGSVTSRGIVWGLSTEPTTSLSTKATSPGSTGVFNSQLTNLSPNTKYFVRAFATNSAGTAYGSEVTFTTLPLAVSVPVLTTSTIATITTTSAVSGGNITSDGNATITAKGLVWGTTTGPTTASSKTSEAVGSGTGSFSSTLTGLSAGTKYFVRAYATNSAGTAYGNELSFTTVSLPTVTTTTQTAVLLLCGQTFSQKKWTGGGNVTSDGNSAITARGIVWSTTTGPTISLATKTSDGTGSGSFSSTMTGLNYYKKYYVRAYATNSAGTAYGNEVSFVAGDDVGDAVTYNSTCVGIIGYVLKSGDPGYSSTVPHGMIISFNDQSATAQWGCYGTDISYAYCSTLWSCCYNGTGFIVNGCATSGIAAKVARAYTIGGLTGWSLPSRDDLVRISQGITIIDNALLQNGTKFSNAYYWTCSQWSSNTAMTINPENGLSSETNKNVTTRRTRAVWDY